MKRKILVIALKYSYGIKKFGSGLNEKAISKSLEKLGHEVKNIWIDEFKKEELNKYILKKANEYSPDLIFFKLFKDEIDKKTLLHLKSKYKTLNWFGDDNWRFESFSSKYSNLFTYCVTTDKYSIQKYNDLGQENVILSQHASFENNNDYKNINYKYQVSFVGGKSPYREWFINTLERKGIKCICFGNGWSNGRITYEKMNKIFIESKINLNLSNSISYDIRVNLSKPRNFIAILKTIYKGGTKTKDQIKARNFEIPVNGGFQLTKYVATLEDYYTIGKNITCYSNVDEAYLQIKYFLENNHHREKIKNASVKFARLNHTYLNRMQEIINQTL